MPTSLHDHRNAIETASCVLHIGTPKTGSTAIQCFLGDNRAALAAAGQLYPGSIERGHAHHDLAFLTAGGYPEWATAQQAPLADLIAAVRAECQAQPTRCRLLLSSENFYWLSAPEAVRELTTALGYKPEQIAVVVYLRRQEAAVESWYNQLVKALGYSAGFGQSINDYDSLWDYDARLAHWATVFGTAQIVLRLYPDDDTGFDARRDFIDLLGIDGTGLDYAPSRPNQRLVRDLLEFQRVINRLPLPTVDKRRYHKQLIRLSAEGAALGLDDTPLHTRASRAAVCERYAAGNRAVAQTYFGRDDLFPPSAAEVAEGAEPPPLAPDKLATIFAWLLMSHPEGNGSTR